MTMPLHSQSKQVNALLTALGIDRSGLTEVVLRIATDEIVMITCKYEMQHEDLNVEKAFAFFKKYQLVERAP